MVDKKKVIKGLECCAARNGTCEYKQEPICPYVKHCQKEDYAALQRDALALLKEHDELLCKLQQEEIKPVYAQDVDSIPCWRCGSCGSEMYHIYDGIDEAKEYAKFCRQCGKKVKWE